MKNMVLYNNQKIVDIIDITGNIVNKIKWGRWNQTSQEEFDDTKGVIRSHKSKKNRQHNCQKKKDKRTSNDA